MKFENKVIYQIYPKSFYDTNNDGIGDLKGITEKLDYLKYLGIDCIWITPFFISPQKDNGYDVADYYNIDPVYGTMEDFENLSKEAQKRGIGIMLDMVFNHTSTEHQWFKKAISGDKKYENFYIFKNGDGENPPTNWVSKFGGNAWEYSKELGMYYLHLFDKTQADLNWENPEVREEIYKIVKFWMEKGVNGFRFDVVNLISKPAVYENDYIGDGRRFYTDGPKIHEFLKELNKNTFGKDEDIITVGEMSSTSMENCFKYSGKDENELSMVFNFHHLKVDYKNKDKWALQPFDFQELKDIFNSWQVGMQKNNGWSALFWCNHDQPRIVSRLGDDKNYWKKSAKMLGTVIHMLRGTPYIYQGEEIGMTNPYFNKITQYRDVESLNYFEILKNKGLSSEEAMKILMERSRDNSRTPMQWNSNKNAGFTQGTPWIDVIYNYKDINVEEQIKDEDSILNYYRKLIELRKKYEVISLGKTIPLAEKHKNIYMYKRVTEKEELLVISNFYGVETSIELDFNIEGYENILNNNNENTKLEKIMVLKSYDVMVFHKTK
ncbi:MAG: alpha,alpha-phosphotrehalase [Fusobacterium perfoetens]|uniref:alpha,alpha-phosphotrehalase n=1 Tax=Fusobacterium perfoetens TaxID=852 RepID=UPI0023F191B5|nr:alpha,alpha-phosphotrehalase [Fusobacterium perfoetens]MCI6152223.1 alpha,alpha-phosphotrehalase [Fusobacterium perfoetens]MDY3237708.1 alpha,alpha-phosphotrehalase [Fusobacterium perfoetens]